MPIHLHIIAEGKVIVLEVEDPWQVVDLKGIYPLMKAHMDKAAERVHTLVDLRKMSNVPARALWERHSPSVTHPKSGYIAIIGGPMFARSLAETAFKLMNFNRVRFFDREDVALNFLCSEETQH